MDMADFVLPPTPALPSWLDSMCSQIDSFSNSTLPQIFTPREVTYPRNQQHRKCNSLAEYGNTIVSSAVKDNTFQKRFVIPDNYDGLSNQDAIQQYCADNAPATQPWPSLTPECARADWLKDTRASRDDVIEDNELSQPWPSCEVRRPSIIKTIGPKQRTSKSCARFSPYHNALQDIVSPASGDYFGEASPPPVARVTLSDSMQKSAGGASNSLSYSQDLDCNFKKPNRIFTKSTGKPISAGVNPRQKDTNSAIQLHRQAHISSGDPVSLLNSKTPQRACGKDKARLVEESSPFPGTDADVRAADTHSNNTPGFRGDPKSFTPTPLGFEGYDGKGTKLRSVEEIPQPYRDIFSFPFFNAVQSQAFDQLLYTDNSVVVSAPTGSGKTALFELAIVRLLLRAEIQDIKIIYIGPMKSLCNERVDDWTAKMSPLGLRCMELTGDSDLSDFTSLHHVQVICTTPEKWDSVTRRWKDNRKLFQSVSLVCIDEVHVVGDVQRGATLEAVITRMKMVQTQSTQQPETPLRFVAASATLPNTEDIAEWLSSDSKPVPVYKLGEEYRPVRLQRVVIGYPFSEGSSEFRFDLHLNYKLLPIIDTYSHGKPTLVFCSSRKSCQQTGEMLVKRCCNRSSFVISQYRHDVLAAASKIREKKLSELVSQGVGVHHAGLDMNDRRLVEELFRAGKLAILIATSTLSVGVNLPAHLVVVKATHIYIMGAAREYSDQQLLQMMGRAGRPQFDTSATVVVMTKAQLKSKYESLVNGTQIIESMLHKNLTEHVNVEVVLNTITDMADAAFWLSHTLLQVRATKNPRHYGLPTGLSTQQVEKRLQDLCMTAVNRLNSLQLVSVDADTSVTSPTDRGRLMARYCMEFQTMKLMSEIPMKSHMEHLISVIASCPEFQDIQLRTSEKKILNGFNKNKHQETIRYPIPGKIKTKQMKVNCLIQVGLGCLSCQDYSLSQDLMKIFRVGQRVTKCLMEVQWLGVDHTTLFNTILLCKAFKAKLWPDSKHVARQLEGIGPNISQALVLAGLTSFQLLEAADPNHLQMIVNRHPPFGSRILEAVNHLPRYELTIQQVKNHQKATAVLVIHVSLLNAAQVKSMSTCGADHQLVFVIGDEDNSIVFKWKLADRMLLCENWNRHVRVKRALAGPILYIGLISLDWVGLDIQTQYQPIYTSSVHPQGLAKAPEPTPQKEVSRSQQSTKKKASEGAAKGAKGNGAGQQREAKAHRVGTIQQQLDVMRSKLQQFQRPTVGPQDRLRHDSNEVGGVMEAAKANSLFGFHGNREARSNQPQALRTDNVQHSPTFDLDTEPWADLVRDFWEEDAFDEPPTKTPRITKSISSAGAEVKSGGKVSIYDSHSVPKAGPDPTYANSVPFGDPSPTYSDTTPTPTDYTSASHFIRPVITNQSSASTFARPAPRNNKSASIYSGDVVTSGQLGRADVNSASGDADAAQRCATPALTQASRQSLFGSPAVRHSASGTKPASFASTYGRRPLHVSNPILGSLGSVKPLGLVPIKYDDAASTHSNPFPLPPRPPSAKPFDAASTHSNPYQPPSRPSSAKPFDAASRHFNPCTPPPRPSSAKPGLMPTIFDTAAAMPSNPFPKPTRPTFSKPGLMQNKFDAAPKLVNACSGPHGHYLNSPAINSNASVIDKTSTPSASAQSLLQWSSRSYNDAPGNGNLHSVCSPVTASAQSLQKLPSRANPSPAVRIDHHSKTSKTDIASSSDSKENIPSRMGSGWEHLHLYHSSRECAANQGHTQESSEGEDSCPLSQTATLQHQPPSVLLPPVTLTQSGVNALGSRSVGIVSPSTGAEQLYQQNL